LDTALTGTISRDDKSHVSFITPGCAPRVLHDPVFLVGISIGAVSNNKGSVIEVSSALTIKDTTLVGLESNARSVNTDRDRLNGNSRLHG